MLLLQPHHHHHWFASSHCSQCCLSRGSSNPESPSLSLSPIPATARHLDLLVGEPPYPSVCVTTCSKPPSFDPHLSSCPSVASEHIRRWPFFPVVSCYRPASPDHLWLPRLSQRVPRVVAVPVHMPPYLPRRRCTPVHRHRRLWCRCHLEPSLAPPPPPIRRGPHQGSISLVAHCSRATTRLCRQ